MGKRGIRILLVTLVVVLFLWGMELGSGAGFDGGRRLAYVPGELLVKYKPTLRAAAADYARQRWGVSTLRTFHDIGVHHVKLPADITVVEAVELYRSDPDVEYVEPNYYRYLQVVPHDPDFDLLWGLENTGQPVQGTFGTPGADIEATAAWDRATDCTQVTVAIIDTGADYNHPDLAGNIAPGGRDFVDNDDSPMDPHGHGTHVAGTIAALGDNNRGVAGICWTGKLMILRAFDSFGFATSSDIIAAMAYARTNGAKIINASYAGSDFSQAERDEISNLNSAGILLVAAAGNEGTDNDSNPSYPASYNLPNIIAVAATDQGDNLAWFSNYGRTSVDVAAPGTNIYSAKPGRQTVFSDNFDDNDIHDWTVDAPWGLSDDAYGPGYSLSDSPGGNYDNNVNISARPTGAIVLSGKAGATLTFKLKGTLLSGDLLYVETATDLAGPWSSRPVLVDNTVFFENGISGTNDQWADASVDLGHLDGIAATYFRFRLRTNGSSRADGVYIDNVAITAAAPQDTYQYLTGTSMATPHVSGLAALIWTDNPALTHGEVKARILNSVDRLPGLSGTPTVVTRGRVNAFKSLRNLPAPPVGLSARAVSNTQIKLSWANTYVNPIGFKIERMEGTGGLFTEIADLGSNAASYSDTGLTKSTTYTYRLRAYSSDYLSDYSAEVTATAREPSSGGGGGGGAAACFIATAQKE
jgi:subtilisin family serine protease